jgi:hypothetical protein
MTNLLNLSRIDSTLIISCFFFILSNALLGQTGENNKSDDFDGGAILEMNCIQQDLRDFMRGSKPEKMEQGKSMLLVLPNISSNPANGLLIGVAGSTGFYLGSKESTRVSSIGFNAAYTSRNQFIAFAKSNIYSKEDKIFLQGDWRYFIYNAPTWGLGTNAPDSRELKNSFVWQGAEIADVDDGYKMAYNYLKLHEILNYRIAPHKYIGIGYHLDYFFIIQDNSLQLDTIPNQLTPHYLYSKLHDFDTSNYMLSGFSLNLVYDSRDNLINPYHGYFINFNYRLNPTFLGSDQNSSSLWLEFRTYVPLSKEVPRHLIAFWWFGSFQISGHQPYLTLMALGEDQRARSGRGYIAGRFRGEDLIYGEVEYRFPISPCSKILGGVLFLNATSSSNRSRHVGLFDYIRPGGGVGLRVMLNKNFRTNINLDIALGKKSQGVYFSGTETF